MQKISHLLEKLFGKNSVGSWVVLFGFVLPTIVINILSLSVPIVILQIYDRIIPNKAYETLELLIIGAFVAIILEGFFKMMRARVSLWQSAKFEYLNYCHLFKKLLEAPVEKIMTRSPGELINEFKLVQMKKDLFGGGSLFISLVEVPFVIVYLTLIFLIGTWLVLVPLFVISFLMFAMYVQRAKGFKLQQQKSQLDDRRFNFVSELFNGLHTIKTHAMEALMLRRYERLQKTHGDVIYGSLINSSEMTQLIQFMSQLMMVMIVSFGAIGIIHHHLTLGIVAACTLLSMRSIQPVAKVMGAWDKYSRLAVEEEKYQSIQRMPQQIDLDNKQLAHVQGRVAFEGVSVGSGSSQLLSDVNWVIEPGEVVTLAGPGFSGKTTLLHLISGEVTPTVGQVRIDNATLAENPQMIQRIVYIGPNMMLFQGTILENLNGYDGMNKIERVNKLITQFGLNKFVQRLPKGLHTELTNQSVELIPKGVKQRLILVRTMLQNPKVILFDEANINLDREADQVITHFFETLKGQVTTVIVTHRPSMHKMASQAYKIDQKRVVPMYG